MKKSFEKFITYLEQENKKIVNIIGSYYEIETIILNKNRNNSNIEKLVNKKTVDHFSKTGLIEKFEMIENYLNIFQLSKEELVDQEIIITDYSDLSTLLLECPLSMREKIENLVYVLYKCFPENFIPIIINYDKIKHCAQDFMSPSEFKKFYFSGEIIKFMKSNDQELNEEEMKFKNNLFIHMTESEESKMFRIAMSNLKNHFFNKEKDLNEIDLKFVLISLKCLNVSDELCKGFEIIYQKKISKSDESKKYNTVIKNEEKEFNLTIKENKKIYHEVTKYYDIDNQRAIRPLNLSEIIYLVSLLCQLNVLESDIKKCIQNIYKSYEEYYENPFQKFNAYYDKMMFYADNEDVKLALTYLKDSINILFIPQSSKEYNSWKKEFTQVLDETVKNLKNDCDYEVVTGKKLAKEQYNKR